MITSIELIYAIIFGVISVIGILTITRKMSIGIGLIGIGLGMAIAYILSPYMDVVMNPITQSIFYGAVWDIPAILGVLHIASLVFMVIVAMYNLMASGGKIIWA